MDPNMPGMTSGSAASSTADAADALSTAGLDMSNVTVQSGFLAQLLDDTELQVIANSYARRFWYGVVVIIGLAALLNIIIRAVSNSRMRSAATKTIQQGTSSSTLGRMIRIVAAISRKITYPQISPTHHSNIIKLPPLGIILLLLIYLAFVLALEFVKQDIPGEQHDQAIGIRAGWLTITQLPLLILLSGKVNLIGLITGVGYERLNVLHRWVARTMLLTATLHMGYQQALWNRLGLLQLEWNTDTCPPTGIKAYAFLLWLNLTTLAPIRNLWYEFFILQHILTFICFITFLMLHLPSTALYSRIYVYIPIGLYLLERLLRTLRYTYHNIRPGRATLTHEPGGVTKIIVSSRQLKNWTPGSFVLLSLPRFGIAQSHPATIASIPSSHEGKLVFFLRAHHGFTSRIHENASVVSLPETESSTESQSQATKSTTHLALIDGPYGGQHLDFGSFSSVLLIAGSTGVTFALPILLDLVFRAQSRRLCVREVVFVWAVKMAGSRGWIESELKGLGEELEKVGIAFVVRIFVTGDEEFVEEGADGGVGGLPAIIQSGNADISALTDKPEAALAISQNSEKTNTQTPEFEVESNEGIEGAEKTQHPPPYNTRSHVTAMQVGRPDIHSIVAEARDKAVGELGVAVCGPVGLSAETRRVVASLEGNGRGIYLHAESFGW